MTDILSLDNSKQDYKEHELQRKKFFRKTQIRNIHEMEKKNRAQELRVEEFSVQKLREGHETNTEAHFKKTINARANEF